MSKGREKGIASIEHNGIVNFGISVVWIFRYVANWLWFLAFFMCCVTPTALCVAMVWNMFTCKYIYKSYCNDNCCNDTELQIKCQVKMPIGILYIHSPLILTIYWQQTFYTWTSGDDLGGVFLFPDTVKESSASYHSLVKTKSGPQNSGQQLCLYSCIATAKYWPASQFNFEWKIAYDN